MPHGPHGDEQGTVSLIDVPSTNPPPRPAVQLMKSLKVRAVGTRAFLAVKWFLAYIKVACDLLCSFFPAHKNHFWKTCTVSNFRTTLVLCSHLGDSKKRRWNLNGKHPITFQALQTKGEGILPFQGAESKGERRSKVLTGAPFSLMRTIRNPITDHLPAGRKKYGALSAGFYGVSGFE